MRKTIFVLILMLGIIFGVFCQSPAAGSGPMDLVVLLDTSTSMSNYYRQTSDYLIGPFLKEFLRIGDTVHLISFAGTPRMEISRRIEGVGDVEAVIGRLLLIYPLDPESDPGKALNFAEQYSSSLPGNRPCKFVLISDGDTPGTENLVNAASGRLKGKGADLQYIKVPVTGNGPSSGRPPAQAQTAQGTSRQPAAQPPASQSTISQPAASPASRPPASQPSASQTSSSQPAQGSAAPAAQPSQPGQGTAQATPSPAGTTPAAQGTAPGASQITQSTQPSTTGTTPAAQGTAPGASQTTQSTQPSTAGTTPAAQGIAPGTSQTTPASPPTQAGSASSTGTVPPSTAPAAQQPSSQGTSSVPPAGSSGGQSQPAAAASTGYSSRGSTQDSSLFAGGIPLPLLIGLGILALIILGLLIFFAVRHLQSSPNRAMAQAASSPEDQRKDAELMSSYAEAQKSQARPPLEYPPPQRKPMPKDKIYVAPPDEANEGPIMLNLFVEDQNTAIGRRNIHSVKSGYTFSVGGGKSDFLIFLVPIPAHIADVQFDGRNCTFIPRKAQYFPDIGSQSVPNCIGKTIRVISDKNYELHIRIERYADPLKALNKLLHSISVPGEVK